MPEETPPTLTEENPTNEGLDREESLPSEIMQNAETQSDVDETAEPIQQTLSASDIVNGALSRTRSTSAEIEPTPDEHQFSIDDYVDSMLLKSSLNEVERKSVKAKISWDLMFICFEEEYRDLVVPLFYIPYLDVWYNAGHFPCGIVGKKLPDDWDGRITDGQLIVF